MANTSAITKTFTFDLQDSNEQEQLKQFSEKTQIPFLEADLRIFQAMKNTLKNNSEFKETSETFVKDIEELTNNAFNFFKTSYDKDKFEIETYSEKTQYYALTVMYKKLIEAIIILIKGDKYLIDNNWIKHIPQDINFDNLKSISAEIFLNDSITDESTRKTWEKILSVESGKATVNKAVFFIQSLFDKKNISNPESKKLLFFLLKMTSALINNENKEKLSLIYENFNRNDAYDLDLKQSIKEFHSSMKRLCDNVDCIIKRDIISKYGNGVITEEYFSITSLEKIFSSSDYGAQDRIRQKINQEFNEKVIEQFSSNNNRNNVAKTILSGGFLKSEFLENFYNDPRHKLSFLIKDKGFKKELENAYEDKPNIIEKLSNNKINLITEEELEEMQRHQRIGESFTNFGNQLNKFLNKIKDKDFEIDDEDFRVINECFLAHGGVIAFFKNNLRNILEKQIPQKEISVFKVFPLYVNQISEPKKKNLNYVVLTQNVVEAINTLLANKLWNEAGRASSSNFNPDYYRPENDFKDVNSTLSLNKIDMFNDENFKKISVNNLAFPFAPTLLSPNRKKTIFKNFGESELIYEKIYDNPSISYNDQINKILNFNIEEFKNYKTMDIYINPKQEVFYKEMEKIFNPYDNVYIYPCFACNGIKIDNIRDLPENTFKQIQDILDKSGFKKNEDYKIIEDSLFLKDLYYVDLNSDFNKLGWKKIPLIQKSFGFKKNINDFYQERIRDTEYLFYLVKNKPKDVSITYNPKKEMNKKVFEYKMLHAAREAFKGKNPDFFQIEDKYFIDCLKTEHLIKGRFITNFIETLTDNKNEPIIKAFHSSPITINLQKMEINRNEVILAANNSPILMNEMENTFSKYQKDLFYFEIFKKVMECNIEYKDLGSSIVDYQKFEDFKKQKNNDLENAFNNSRPFSIDNLNFSESDIISLKNDAKPLAKKLTDNEFFDHGTIKLFKTIKNNGHFFNMWTNVDYLDNKVLVEESPNLEYKPKFLVTGSDEAEFDEIIEQIKSFDENIIINNSDSGNITISFENFELVDSSIIEKILETLKVKPDGTGSIIKK